MLLTVTKFPVTESTSTPVTLRQTIPHPSNPGKGIFASSDTPQRPAFAEGRRSRKRLERVAVPGSPEPNQVQDHSNRSILPPGIQLSRAVWASSAAVLAVVTTI